MRIATFAAIVLSAGVLVVLSARAQKEGGQAAITFHNKPVREIQCGYGSPNDAYHLDCQMSDDGQLYIIVIPTNLPKK